MKSLAFATLFAFALAPSYGFAQVSKMSDEDLIKLSLSAAPEAIAKDATVVVMGDDGTMRTFVKEPGSGRACQVTPIRPTRTRCAAIRTRLNGAWPGCT